MNLLDSNRADTDLAVDCEVERHGNSTTTLLVVDGVEGRSAACKLSAYRTIRHNKLENNLDGNLSNDLNLCNGQCALGLRDRGSVAITSSEQSSDDLSTDLQSSLGKPIHAGEARKVASTEETDGTFDEINPIKTTVLLGCTIRRRVAWNRVADRRLSMISTPPLLMLLVVSQVNVS